MTTLQAVERNHSDLIDPSILELLKSDDDHGRQVMDIGNLPCVDLSPLTSCSDPIELGYVKKLLELGRVSQLVWDRKNRDCLTRKRARQVKHRLNYIRLARGLQEHTKGLKGPLQVVKVWGLHLGRNGNTRAVMAVVFIKPGDGRPYGYYFHLKSALYLCGML